jgi:iron complex transport system ATP-binding protein
MVRVEHAVFGYGPDAILRDLSFEVAAGEILCLLGPNGSGKTTLFRCLSGSLRLRSGTIWLGGTDVATIRPLALARLLGVVFQEHAPPFPFTVLDVIRMGRAPHLRFFASPSAADTAIAEGIVARLGLTHLAGQPYTLVSGGERQLVLIGRALCQEPRILLLDEPTSSLDYRNSMLVVRTVTELARSGLTVIMTTHAPDQALLLDGKVALLRDGSFVAYGAAARELTSGNLQRTYDMDIEVASAYVPRIGRSVRVVIPIVDTARPEGRGLSGPVRDPARCGGRPVAGTRSGAGTRPGAFRTVSVARAMRSPDTLSTPGWPVRPPRMVRANRLAMSSTDCGPSGRYQVQA